MSQPPDGPEDPDYDPSRDPGDPPAADPQPQEVEVEVHGLEEKKKGKSCFTPLTLIALVSITLVLGAILVPNYIRARARGQLTACKSNLKNIGTALEMYSTDFSGKYPSSMQQLTPNYLKTLPTCSSSGEMSYVAEFGLKAPYNRGYEEYYFVECHGENHTSVSVTGNFPAYNAIQGLMERRPVETEGSYR